MENNCIATAFKNDEFGSIRIIEENNTFLFCGIDVAYALGYSKPRNAISAHCKGALKRGVLTGGGSQQLTFLPEGDVYRLIVKSKLSSAQKFERWVFDEVLPSIRKHGGYMTDHLLQEVSHNPDVMIQFAKQLLEEHQKSNELQGQVERLQPKAAYYDQFVHNGDCTNIRTTAKELEIPERRFCKYLLNGGFLYRSPSGTLLPYAKRKNKELFVVKDFCNKGYMGSQTLITPKGKAFFYNLFYGGEEE